MCERLGIQKDIQHKIWTCFEHSLVAHIDLMRDRHLDQLILCALYVGAKVRDSMLSHFLGWAFDWNCNASLL